MRILSFKFAPVVFLVLAVGSVIVHNAIFGLFGIEEPVFFLLTFVFAVLFLVSLLVIVLKFINK